MNMLDASFFKKKNTMENELPMIAGETETDYYIRKVKGLRQDLDHVLQRMKYPEKPTRERALAITKVQEGIMWLGMNLKELGAANPYPESYNPSNTIVEPTADNLKL